VLAAFTTQIEHRAAQARAVLDSATEAKRDTLLASEQRTYDAAMRERDAILGLQRNIEQRTEAQAFVPESQRTIPPSQAQSDAISVALAPEQRCLDAVVRRGVRYAGEPGADRLSLGRTIRALAFGDRRGMSDLELRVMSEGTDSAGGYTVPDIQAAQFIDRMRNAMVTQRAGARIVPMDSDVVNIARLASGPTLAWKSENSAITAGDLTLKRVQFTARTLPVLVKMSLELAEDSKNIDAVIERELSAALAGELDRVALIGTGTAPEPRGIRNQSGVTIQGPLGGANGSTPANYDFLIDAAGAVVAANFEVGALARVYHSRTAKTLWKLKEATTNAPLAVPSVVQGWREYLTNALPINLTAGTSTDCTDAFVGDFSELLIGMRTSFRLEVSRQAADATNSAFGNLQVWVRAYLRADIQLAHPAAFAVVTGIRP
jgi:HK97 family phage major capsid protein